MNKTANTWRLVPVDAAQHELAEVRASLGFLPQGYAAMAGLERLADLLAASEPSTLPRANATEHDEPVNVTVDHDPRGVSVGVWQGSHCIYSGAHPLPAAADASTAAHTYGAPAEVAARIEHYLTHNGQENSASLLLYEAMKALRAPAAGDALDAARWRAYARLFPEVSTSFLATHAVDGVEPLPTIKGAAITGGHVVVTPAGWDADKATKLRDAILRLFPVNPAHTPRPSDELAAQRKGGA
ncbi:hypothetical protein [Achromobacter xylosoxidans]|uniref:hypothetical protein n=1 Tax=Alcaligenes xylosoxydans xylosoxydans TaxID=85698 RepID=UPI0022B89587|nr:hypothetical protein [Achromobacter xylosoxidans]MCZ8437156.1 hypothetical protein [Achromobacter xylosoxidans]